MLSSLLWVLVIVALAVLLALAIAVLSGPRGPRYRARPLMTPNEIEFFGRLTRAVPEMYIFPQVSMAAVIEPDVNSKEWMAAFGRISQKRIDYCVCTPAMEMVAIVELDDRTHDAARDAVRDSYTASAGIPTLRFESRSKPSVQVLRDAMLDVAVQMQASRSPRSDRAGAGKAAASKARLAANQA